MTITLGWWALPVATFLAAAAWVFWPRPEEWASNGDYSCPDGILYGPARAAVATIVTLVAIVVWRW